MEIYPAEPNFRMEDQFRTSLWLVEMMVSVMQGYFGTPERIAVDNNSFLWNPEQPQAGLYINTIDNLDYQQLGSRPAILVDLENQSFPAEVQGDQHSYNQRDGEMSYLIRTKSAWLVECWATKKLEAMTLGDEVRLFLHTYRHHIAKKYCFDKIRVAQQIKPVKYQEYGEHWIARVVVEFELQDNWSVEMEALRVTGFGLKLGIGKIVL